MMAQNRILVSTCVLVALAAGGCGSHFAGEWVQESVAVRDGTLTPLTAERRMALRFDPPTSVRVGMYVEAAGVVQAQTVTLSEYSTLQNRTVAQFGAYTARVKDGQLVTYIGGDETARFRRVKGRSIFPSRIQLPHIASADPPARGGGDAPVPRPESVANGPRTVTAVVAVAE